ncbi:MAG TPA: hypothetical protein V6C58_15485 [Allocoleopsis sp.]
MKEDTNNLKSFEKLESFISFCKENSELRFWQALRAWADVDKVLVEKDGVQVDTFYE